MSSLQRISNPVKRLVVEGWKASVRTQTAAAAVEKKTDQKKFIKAVDTDDQAKLLKVQWSNGKESKYPYVWLRDNAPTPTTVKLSTNFQARSMLFRELDLDVKPYSLKTDEDGSTMTIQWKRNGDRATYSSAWLDSRDFADDETRRTRPEYQMKIPPQTWGVAEVVKQPKVDFQKFMTDDTYLLEALERFVRFGIMHMVNAPKDPDQMPRLQARMGYLYNTHHAYAAHLFYDFFFTTISTYHIQTYVDPSSIGYTNQELELHTDFPSLGIPPPIVILHCVRQAGFGGESHLCDGFHVAELLRQEKPEVFQRLTRPVMEYIDVGKDEHTWHNVQRRPVIELDDSGEKVKTIYFSNHTRSWFYDLTAEEANQHFEDLKVFHDYCYEERNLWELGLKSGEITWVDNRRILHGRAAFEAGPLGEAGERHVAGCYMGFDPVHSKIRVVKANLNTLGQASL